MRLLLQATRNLTLIIPALIMSALLAPIQGWALEPIDHPDVSALSGSVRQKVERAQQQLLKLGTAASGSAYGELAMVYQAHEMFHAARQSYGNAVEKSPADARWPYFLGILAQADGDFERSLRWFKLSVELNPEYLPMRIRLARVHLDAGAIDLAESSLLALLEKYPAIAAIHSDLGQLALNAGDYDRAINYLLRALELQPDATRVHYPLAMAYRGLGNLTLAKEHLQQQGSRQVIFDDLVYNSMRRRSSSFAFYMSLGLTAARNSDFETALELMTSAVEANPESSAAHINHARMLEATGKAEAGIRELTEVLRVEPDNALAEFNLGAMHEVRADDLQAVYHYERAVAIDPEMFDARLLLGNALMRQQAYAPAAEQFELASKLRAQRTLLLLKLAIAQQAAQQCTASLDTLYQLVSQLPENFEALIAYSRVAATCAGIEQRHRLNALNAARNMYQIAPELEVVTTLAMVEAAVGNFDDAVEYQSQAIFSALREGLQEKGAQLNAVLQRYQSKQPPTRPWPDDFALLHPPALTISDRY